MAIAKYGVSLGGVLHLIQVRLRRPGSLLSFG